MMQMDCEWMYSKGRRGWAWPILVIVILLLLPRVADADTRVENVRFEPQGDKVVVFYDLHGSEEAYTIRLKLSSDGGKRFDVVPRTVSRDVGEHVSPGLGKQIAWEALKDVEELSGDRFVFAVTASWEGGGMAGMVLIPGGSFRMGDPFNEGDSDERPVHTVYVDAFYMDVYEVTNAQYRAYDPSHDSGSYGGHSLNGDDQPVVVVSWWDAIQYCNGRSRGEGLEEVYNESTGEADLTKNGYRLPTEAEWEYAARGGLGGKRYPWGDEAPGCQDGAHNGARFDDNDRCNNIGTAPVGSYAANGYGLYDMAGNVWEWVHDWYASDYDETSPSSNPTGLQTGTYRVLRGGSWYGYPYGMRCANRYGLYPTYTLYFVGFRCVRSP